MTKHEWKVWFELYFGHFEIGCKYSSSLAEMSGLVASYQQIKMENYVKAGRTTLNRLDKSGHGVKASAPDYLQHIICFFFFW